MSKISAETSSASARVLNGELPVDMYIPKRAKTFDQAQRTPLRYRLLAPIVGRSMAPTPYEYRKLIEGLSAGDDVMDEYVTWMFATSARSAKEKFDQALHHGIESVSDCPEPLRKLFTHVETAPDWVNPQLIQDAQIFMQSSGMNAVYVLRDLALMGGYLLSGFNHALVMTGALNNDASKRFAETAKWWMDCTEEGGLERFSGGFKSTLHVRFIHALVRRNLAANPKWNADQWGQPLNQIDMSSTIFGFGTVFLLGLRTLGIIPTLHESKSVMHLWRYTGWLMGVDEHLLSDSEAQSTRMLYHGLITQSPPDWTSQALGRALSQEPLKRQYQRFNGIRRRYDYYKHMSVTSLFLTGAQMEQLGMHKRTIPWFPIMIAPLNAVTANVPRLLPKARGHQQKQGRQAQWDFMATFGEHGLKVIQPEKNHPAHVA